MPDTLERTVEQLARQAATRYYGKYRGIVTNVDDPQGLCRIQARVPAVMGDTEVGWALPAFPFAGNGHGHVMLPAVDSMVWIEFEAGHLDMPIWTGSFFVAGQRPSPDTTGARVIVTPGGHEVVVDDDNGEVRIRHSGGAELVMTADSIKLGLAPCSIEITTSSISLNDGQVKVGLAGVSLAQGAMSLGVAP